MLRFLRKRHGDGEYSPIARIKWVLARPTIEFRPEIKRERSAIDAPSTCPKCNKAEVIRLLLNYDLPLSDKEKKEVEDGRAMFIPSYGPRELTWVCLYCSPEWSEVQKQVADEERMQLAMEKAAALQDSDTVARCWKTKTDLYWQWVGLVNHLLN